MKKAILITLLSFWIFLFVFGIISMQDPKWLRNISSQDRRNEALVCLNSGDYHLSKGNYRRAIDNYRKATKIIPDYGDAFMKLGIAYREMGAYKKSENYFLKALNNDLSSPNLVYGYLGSLAERADDYEEAFKYYSQAASINPDPTRPLAAIGKLLLRKHEIDSAIVYLQKAKRTLEDFRFPYLQSVKKAIQFHSITHPTEKEAINKAKQKYKDGIQSVDLNYYAIGILEQDRLRSHEAAQIYYTLGIAYCSRQDFRDGIPLLEKAVDINPNNPLFRDDLKLALENQKNYVQKD